MSNVKTQKKKRKKEIQCQPVKSESLTRCLLVPWDFPCCYRFYHRAVKLATNRQTPIDITIFLHLIFPQQPDFFPQQPIDISKFPPLILAIQYSLLTFYYENCTTLIINHAIKFNSLFIFSVETKHFPFRQRNNKTTTIFRDHMRQNEIRKPRRTENTFFIMQTLSGTVTEFRFVPDVIAKDGNSFLLLCLKGETLISLCLLIEVY